MDTSQRRTVGAGRDGARFRELIVHVEVVQTLVQRIQVNIKQTCYEKSHAFSFRLWAAEGTTLKLFFLFTLFL